MASRLVAIAIALSFIATVLPIATASADTSKAMSCCAGKTPGHCDSTIFAPKPQPKSEPMCGLDSSELEDDGITIIAEPPTSESHHSHAGVAESASSRPAAESASLDQPCKMDCGACTSAASRQQKREKAIAQARTRQGSNWSMSSYIEAPRHFFSSNEDWSRINPRGPPASR
jgi:hypothetical protein